MNKQKKTYGVNKQIVKLAIFGLLLSMLIGCQQVNDLSNSNGNTSVEQANSSANSNSNADKTLKNSLVGTWIGTTADNKFKLVFTEDEFTQYSGDKIDGKGKYKVVDEQTIEFKDEKTGNTSQEKVTVKGDELTVILEGKTTIFKRESNESSENNTSSVNSASVQDIEKKLIGTWIWSEMVKKKIVKDGKIAYEDVLEEKSKYVFGNQNQYLSHDIKTKIPFQRSAYRIDDAETLTMLDGNGFGRYGVGKTTYKLSFEDDNTMTWIRDGGTPMKLKRKSNKSELTWDSPVNNINNQCKLIGNWISIAGTNSEKERLSIWCDQMVRYDKKAKYDTWDIYHTNCNNYVINKYCEFYLDGSNKGKIFFENDILEIDENNVKKKYERQTTFD